MGFRDWRLAARAGSLIKFWKRAYGLWREMAVSGASVPVFQRELRHWDQGSGRRWRLEDGLGLLALANLCLTPVVLMIFPGLLLVQAVLDELIGVGVSLPAASLVVGERDQRTWGVLRATALSSAEILMGKTAGLLYLFWRGAGYIVLARLLGTLLVLPLLGLMLALPRANPFAPAWPVGLALGGLLLLYLAFVNRPLINLAFSGCLGLLASTAASTTRRAVALTMAAHLVLALLSAGVVAWLASWVHLPFSDSVLGQQLRQIFTWLLPLGLITLARGLLAPALFALAVYRAEQCPD